MSFLGELSISINNGDIELSNVNCKKTIILDSKNDSINGSIKKRNTNLPLLKEDGKKHFELIQIMETLIYHLLIKT